MTRIPTKKENPRGLYQKYRILKANGAPVDPEAVYFVLRLDRNCSDLAHLEACREAVRAYADEIGRQSNGEHLADLACDLLDLLNRV